MLDVEPGDVISDRYEVERELGRGGMATVYQVRHRELKSRHALKLLDISSSSVRKRLLQEGRIQASLAHPHIVTVTDVLDVQGNPGLVMEFVDGPTLADVLAKRRPSLADAEAWFRSILTAVGYAHSRGLVHRDLKPENILMANLDGRLHPKVADFGIAKVLGELGGPDQPGTRAGMAMGTPAYMPPEQVNSAADADQRADVFALGCILYELVTGQRAFPSENVLSVFTAVLKGDYIPPQQLEPSLEPRIVTAIERALDPERSTRTQTVSEFIAILDARLAPVDRAGPLASATPPPAAGSTLPIVGAAGAVLTVVALAAGVFLVIGLLLGFGMYRFLGASHQPERVHVTGLTVGAVDEPKPAGMDTRARVPRDTAPVAPKIALEITSWRQVPRVRDGVMKFRSERGALLIAQVDLRNLTQEDLGRPFPWKLFGPDGQEYEAPLGCHLALDGSLNPFERVEASEHLVGPLCFDGPAVAEGGYILFDGDDEATTVRFPL